MAIGTSATPQYRVVICGAGIAGLCAGIAMVQAGHKVTILERARELAPLGVGLHIPPNATLVLKQYGLLEQMAKDAESPLAFNFREWKDGQVVKSFPAPERAENAPPYWHMRRCDYQKHLLDAALRLGCQLRLAARVEHLDMEAPAVTLHDGDRYEADLVIVADGVKSKLRDQIIPEDQVAMKLHPLSAYRAFIHGEDLRADPITAPVFKEKSVTNVWNRNCRHVTVYPCGGDKYTFGATHPTHGDAAMDWSKSVSAEEAQKDFSDWTPVLGRILHHSRELKRWRLAEVPRLSRWTSTSGKVVLMGDAAHGMLPFVASGAAMAVEDSAALVECLKRASTTDMIPKAMQAYEKARKWRCEIVQAQSARSGEMHKSADTKFHAEDDSKPQNENENAVEDPDSGPIMDTAFRDFLYGHDVYKHTRKVLDSMQM